MGYAARVREVARELALAKQAERQARLREAEKAAAAYNAEFLTRQAVSAMTGFSPATLRRLNAEGRGPRPIKLGETRQARLRYPRSEVVSWMTDRQAYESANRPIRDARFSPPPRTGKRHPNT
jgi:predicted DNA-binding transcriptional regulator AlpA